MKRSTKVKIGLWIVFNICMLIWIFTSDKFADVSWWEGIGCLAIANVVAPILALFWSPS